MIVEPIRDIKKIKQMQDFLKGKDKRCWLLFNFGLNTGLRISDILPIKVSDVMSEKLQFREHFDLVEMKTKKPKKIRLNDNVRKYIKEFIKEKNLTFNDYLFISRKGGHIQRIQAWKILSETANALGIEHFGTHSMRKTWGYWTYKASKYNIGLIMDVFNHSSQKITLRYIGISQDQKDELYSLVQF